MEIKPEIKFGLMAAIAAISLTLLQYGLGWHSEQFNLGHYSSYALYIFLFLCLNLNLREKRIDLGIDFSFRKAMRSSLILLLIASVMSSGFLFVYSYHINPLWVEAMVQWQAGHNGFSSVYNYNPNETTLVLSNTEIYLCLYFLSQMVAGLSIAFAITAYLLMGKKSSSTGA